jgi:hypothetical protein
MGRTRLPQVSQGLNHAYRVCLLNMLDANSPTFGSGVMPGRLGRPDGADEESRVTKLYNSLKPGGRSE